MLVAKVLDSVFITFWANYPLSIIPSSALMGISVGHCVLSGRVHCRGGGGPCVTLDGAAHSHGPSFTHPLNERVVVGRRTGFQQSDTCSRNCSAWRI